MLVIQLALTQIEIAAGVKVHVGGNNSGTSIQGIGPRPTAKQATKVIRNTGAIAGNVMKAAARAKREAAEPAILKRATGRLPNLSNNQIATKVMTKFMKARMSGVVGESPIIMTE